MTRPYCERCGDVGFVEINSGGITAMARCACVQRKIERRRLRRVNAVVPGIFRTVGLESNPLALLPKSQKAKLRAYQDRLAHHLENGKGLWLAGESGVGKTAAAALITRRAAELGFTTRFCEVPDLLNRLRWTYRDDAPMQDQELYHDLQETELLILDDLGAPRVSDWVLEQLFIFVNARYKTGRAIVVTCDLEPYELSRQIGKRTVRRITDICGKPLVLTMPTEDTTDTSRDVADADDVQLDLVAE